MSDNYQQIDDDAIAVSDSKLQVFCNLGSATSSKMKMSRKAGMRTAPPLPFEHSRRRPPRTSKESRQGTSSGDVRRKMYTVNGDEFFLLFLPPRKGVVFDVW